MRQNIFQLDSVNDWKRALEQRLGDLKSDEIVVLLRRVAILGDLHHVESELRLQMRGVVLRVPTELPYFARNLGYLNGNGPVNGRMAGDVGGIVRQRAQGKGVLVGILTLREQLANEIAAANVVHQIAEFDAAKRIVAKILNDGAAIGISVRLREFGLR